MKEYPTINSKCAPNLPCLAFQKLDGSNVRFEWSKKNGFYKFGTRNRLFDASDEMFGSAIKLFQDKYADDVSKIILKHKQYREAQYVVCFAEFFGPSSFAGWHDATETHDVVLFDVAVHKHGILDAKQFIDLFGGLHIPEIIYDGNYGQQFRQDVYEGKYIDKSFEGIVAKGGTGHKMWMSKQKTKAWLDKLKEKHPDSFDELA